MYIHPIIVEYNLFAIYSAFRKSETSGPDSDTSPATKQARIEETSAKETSLPKKDVTVALEEPPLPSEPLAPTDESIPQFEDIVKISVVTVASVPDQAVAESSDKSKEVLNLSGNLPLNAELNQHNAQSSQTFADINLNIAFLLKSSEHVL